MSFEATLQQPKSERAPDLAQGAQAGLRMEQDLAANAQSEAGDNAGTLLAATTEASLAPEMGENLEARQRFLDRARAKKADLQAKGSWDSFVQAFPELAD